MFKLTGPEPPPHPKTAISAFTLAEVLITLGVIGIVAALTMPSIISNVQKTVLKNQFKSAYSKFSQAVFLTQTKLGTPIGCSYWGKSEQYPCTEKCTSIDPVYNSCISWTCSDGSPLPSNYNGPRDDCAAFEEELFTKTLKVVKFCENNALASGCLTSAYRGTDKVKEELSPGAPPSPNSEFSDSNIKNRFSSWILADGILIMKYGYYKTDKFPIYAIDVNGHKGPNKWGHDIFAFILRGDYDGIKRIDPYNTVVVEKGGKTTQQMIRE